MKDERFKILISPFFLLALIVLMINDFYLKIEFGNWLTGKLSDIAGLFVFPLFLTVLFPKRIIECFIGTAILFAFWKLPSSEVIIIALNNFNIPLGRTVDLTDLYTLIILPFAFYYRKLDYKVLRFNPGLIAFVSLFAFCATVIPPKVERSFVDINKTYEFNYSKDILIMKLNQISTEKMSKAPKHWEVQFDSSGDLFYSEWKGDTLAILLDSKQVTNTDTIHYETVLADFVINGNEYSSSLTFITAFKLVKQFSDKDYREKAIKEFEKEVIKKLNKN